jgi:thiol:disulfide interchange protein DsbD
MHKLGRGAAAVGLVALGLLAGSGTGGEAASRGRHVKARLVAETDAVVPGVPLQAGVHLVMDPGWHTYWRNPGDAGLPTKAKWTLPEGFSAAELQWPWPGRFNTGPLVSFGYEKEVLLPVEIRVPQDLGAKSVTLSAKVSWLECEQICLPGKAELSLTLPVAASAAPGPVAKLFAAARDRLPAATDQWGISTSVEPASIELTVTPPGGGALEEAYFYPVTRKVLDYSKPQALRSKGARSTLVLPRDPKGKPVDRIEGVLVGRTGDGPVALEVDMAVDGTSR